MYAVTSTSLPVCFKLVFKANQRQKPSFNSSLRWIDSVLVLQGNLFSGSKSQRV